MCLCEGTIIYYLCVCIVCYTRVPCCACGREFLAVPVWRLCVFCYTRAPCCTCACVETVVVSVCVVVTLEFLAVHVPVWRLLLSLCV